MEKNPQPRTPPDDTPATVRPRDFVEVESGLLFAVVAHGLESQRVLAFLRYVRDGIALKKVGTDEANELLERQFPEFLFHSSRRDVPLHGVPVERIVMHHKPGDRLAQILESGGRDPMEQRVARAASVLGAGRSGSQWLGVTGSVLVGAHSSDSDIDLVIYDREMFEHSRERLLAELGQGAVQPLGEPMWRECYRRRACSLTFDQYRWHELRKLNKFMLEGTKVDLSWVGPEQPWSRVCGRKQARRVIQATVTDDRDRFGYPSRYVIEHPEIGQVISYNPTYTGQAENGERIEAAGWVEQLDDGHQRLMIGTSREAPGEYIRVTE